MLLVHGLWGAQDFGQSRERVVVSREVRPGAQVLLGHPVEPVLLREVLVEEFGMIEAYSELSDVAGLSAENIRSTIGQLRGCESSRTTSTGIWNRRYRAARAPAAEWTRLIRVRSSIRKGPTSL